MRFNYPLNVALRYRHKEVASLLLDTEVDFSYRDQSGLSAFEWALKEGLYEIAYEIYKRGHPYQPRYPNQQLKVPYQNLYQFDTHYF